MSSASFGSLRVRLSRISRCSLSTSPEARLFRDMESTRQAYDKLRDREMESVVSEQLIKMPGNAAARIIDPANLPTKPRGLSKKMMVALLGLLGFLSGSGGLGRAGGLVAGCFSAFGEQIGWVLVRLGAPRRQARWCSGVGVEFFDGR